MAVDVKRQLTRHEAVALERLQVLGRSPVGGMTLTREVIKDLELVGYVRTENTFTLWATITPTGILALDEYSRAQAAGAAS